MPSSTSLSEAPSLTSPPPCDKDVPLLRSPLFEKNASVMRAFHSVYAFAYALDKVSSCRCRSDDGDGGGGSGGGDGGGSGGSAGEGGS